AEDAFTRVIRVDPAREGLLYAGTETGLWISFDDGDSWQPFQLNLPIAPIHELLIKNNDLIAGTHGRSIWILDDLTPLHQWNDSVGTNGAHLFAPRASEGVGGRIDWSSNLPGKNYVHSVGGAYTVTKTPENGVIRKYLDAGQNPPQGAIVTYYLDGAPSDPIKLTFADAQGNEIRTFTSRKPGQPIPTSTPSDQAAAPALGGTEGGGEAGVVAEWAEATADDPAAKELKIPSQAGWNRFVWDMRHAPTAKIEGKDPASEMTIDGPVVAPGTYTATLAIGDQKLSQTFDVICDQGAPASEEDLQAQHDLLLKIHKKLDSTIKAVNRMRDLRAQLDGWNKRAENLENGKSLAETAKQLRDKVLEIEKTILIPDLRAGWADNYTAGVRLLEKLASLPGAINLGNYRPTDQAHEAFEYMSGKIDEQLLKFNQLIESDLPGLNKQIADAQFGAVMAKQ
ncbi:MAG TPA: glycosyl hydrolase, partial [Roseiflexaceae bacterium]|nr:glycosyl hydrolase [Roseiflexaceae bacterium]